jgi:hypothetical protein
MKTDNELIAEFMGFPYETSSMTFSEPRKLVTSKRKLEYHTSWDWLMPVVGKIGTLWEPYPSQFDKPCRDVCSLPMGSHIQQVYKKVVEFIKWYNPPTQG